MIIPNSLIRSSIFTVKRLGSERKTIKGAVFCQSGYSISMKSEILTQTDSIVMQACLYCCGLQGLRFGKKYSISVGDICLALDGQRGGSDYNRAKESLARLGKASFFIEYPAGSFAGRLFQEMHVDGSIARFSLNPCAEFMFQSGEATYIDLEVKTRLGSAVSMFMHDFLSSHDTTRSELSVDYLKRLCGSSCSSSEFKRILSGAMKELASVGFSGINGWRFEGSKMVVCSDVSEIDESFNPFEI